MNMKSVKVGLALAAAATIAYASRADMDLTAYLRNEGATSYSVTLEPGTAQSAEDVVGMVDGVKSGSNGRLLVQRIYGNDKRKRSNWSVVYTMKPQAHPDWLFKVNSFIVYRLTDYPKRTARDFTLEGSLDGVTWTELYRTDEKLNWTYDTTKTFEIPSERRGAYNHYRFSMHPDFDAPADVEDEWHIGIHELVLKGEIGGSRLTWNGSEGDGWTSSTKPWAGLASGSANWLSQADAVFGANGISSVAVAENVEVSDLLFDASTAHAISGAALQVPEQVCISAGYRTVIGSDISYSAFAGYSGWMPADPGNFKQGLPVLLWRNRKLADMTPTTAKLLQNSELLATAQRIQLSADGQSMSTQFQVMNGALLGMRVEFTQVGNDIWGRVANVRYSYVKDRQLGDDLDTAGGDIYEHKLRDAVVSLDGYMLKDISATGGFVEAPKAMKVTFSRGGCVRESDTWLPRSDENPNVGKPIAYWKNRSVRDLKDITAANICYGSSALNTTVHYFANDGELAVAQFQGNVSNDPTSARLCVKVEFRQSGDDVSARVVYVKYDWNDKGPHDFDSVSADTKIFVYDDEHKEGYGVRRIEGSFSGNLTLNGSVNDHALTAVGDGVLTLGMPAIALEKVTQGDAILRFAPVAGTQAVSVNETVACGAVRFDGATTFSLAQGAKLSFSAAEVGASAAVVFVGDDAEDIVRIGTSRCLSREDLGRLTLNGRPVSQTADGFIVPRQGLVIMIR